MKPIISMTLAVAVAASAMAAAQGRGAQDAERLLKAAMNTELVDGNLKAAIEQDQRVTGKGSWNDSPEYALFPKVSRDGRQVAYAWLNRDLLGELRLLSLASTGSKPRVLVGGPDVQYIDVTDWSPDNNWLAVRI